MPTEDIQVNVNPEADKTYPAVTDDILLERLKIAISYLYQYERLLLETRVNERSITPVLCHYLKTQFPDHDVDTEYDRNKGLLKRVFNADTRFRPDIIVHKRGSREDKDLLVVEVKLIGRGSAKERENDLKKVEYLVHNRTAPKDYRYQVGVFLDLGVERYVLKYIRRERAEYFDRNP